MWAFPPQTADKFTNQLTWAGGGTEHGVWKENVPDALPILTASHEQKKKIIACLLDTKECGFN